MEYLKPALTFEAQADQLIARGLEADRTELIQRLSAVSYYRLSPKRPLWNNPIDLSKHAHPHFIQQPLARAGQSPV